MEATVPAALPTPDQRKAMLVQHLGPFARSGWRIESQSDYNATLVKGHRPNHVLHLILSVLTLGLWLIVWAIIAIAGGEKRRVISIDEQGRIGG